MTDECTCAGCTAAALWAENERLRRELAEREAEARELRRLVAEREGGGDD